MQSQDLSREDFAADKKELGQYYTYNAEYILQGLQIPKDVKVIEPFAGNGQLCLWSQNKGVFVEERYDLEPQDKLTIKRDTLLAPPDYAGKFVLTNPPFLAKNKAKNKEYFEVYDAGDLYKCFLSSVVRGAATGGIVIVPLNFFCDDRGVKVRDEFLLNYSIKRLNIFEESVFDDTTYTVCAFQFEKTSTKNTIQKIEAFIYPANKNISISLKQESNWKVGAEIDDKVESEYKISRLTRAMKEGKDYTRSELTNIFLRSIDSGAPSGRLRLEYCTEPFYGKETDRAFATLIIKPAISADKQKKLINLFNERMENLREKYNSLFLINYRNSTKSYARKRIKFTTVYNILKALLREV